MGFPELVEVPIFYYFLVSREFLCANFHHMSYVSTVIHTCMRRVFLNGWTKVST